ncbi:MAG: sigma-70 family RNA polymerase sigma factor [Planctomycetota bacterium]
MTDALQPDPRWDLRHRQVRRLARQLVRDECAADDLAQEAVLRALRAGREDASDGWWARVLRNLVRDRARRAGRARDHERPVAAGPTAPAADDVVAEAEFHRRVTDALLGLDEPYRTVLLLRHVRDLPPRAIARRLDRPVGTVKVQLERGRALLRRRLGGELSAHGPLAVALLPLVPNARAAALAPGGAASAPAPVSIALGALLMNVKWIAAGGVLALVLGWVAVESRDDDVGRNGGPPPDHVDVERRSAARAPETAPPVPIVPVEGARRPGQAAAAPARSVSPGEVDATSAPDAVPGRALLLDGTPVPGIELHAIGSVTAVARTGADGRFLLEGILPGTYDLFVEEPFLRQEEVATVDLPTAEIELRLDAVLVDFALPQGVAVPDPSMPWFSLFGGSLSAGVTMGGAWFDGDGVLTRLIPSGNGCILRVDLEEPPGSLAGVLWPGHASGSARVPVVQDAPGLGSVRAQLVGDPLEKPDRVSISLEPIASSFIATPPDSGGFVTIAHGERMGLQRNVLPGQYEMRVRVFDFPPLQHWTAESSEAEVEVVSGREARCAVHLQRGGRVELLVDADTTEPVAPLRLELWDVDVERWKRLSVAFQEDADTLTISSSVPRAVGCWTEHVLRPGTLRLRIAGDGWRTAVTTLDVVAGETTLWRPRLHRAD